MARNWDSLSQAYRSRLERGGITRRDYESGKSLSKARGHGTTPEHIGQGKQKSQYRKYYEHRQRLEAKLNKWKKDYFQGADRWDQAASEKQVSQASIKQLEYITSYDDLDDYIEDHDIEDWDDAIFYH